MISQRRKDITMIAFIARSLALLSFMFVAGEGYHQDKFVFVVIGILGCIVTLVLMVGSEER
jgi:hypothetical protein